ncbi:MAG: FAD-dependent protein [Verrucomicrobiota bacterium]
MPSPDIRQIDIILPLEKSEDLQAWKRAAAKILKLSAKRVHEVRLLKHSIDARQQRIKVQLRVEVGIDAPLPEAESIKINVSPASTEAKRVIIVGCGPAGMFAALRCLERGLKPIILERGKDASARRFDLGPLMRKGTVIEDSNYCFGEGGAGTYSDGKLYTRAKKRGPVRKVYEILVAHGAPEQILIDAHPHIGSNLLPKVVMAMRKTILEARGEVHFGAKVTGFLRTGDRICGVRSSDEREFTGSAVILATGHSARDVFQLCLQENIPLEQKAFAMGVRIEHPQPFIDQWQYHLQTDQSRPKLLPAARYAIATKIRGRGVHSFCMCPGGFIVPAATENDEVVVNGMSLSKRGSPFANSGLVVTVEPEDTAGYQREHGVLAGVAMQKALEISASQAGGGMQQAPAQTVADFLNRRTSSVLPKTSYFPGITPAPLHELMPAFITERMQAGLLEFGRKNPEFIRDQANLIGFETRTSSPVRIPRQPDTLEHPECPGLFPCGEGAGFAGGIVSAALDGLRCAEAIAA